MADESRNSGRSVTLTDGAIAKVAKSVDRERHEGVRVTASRKNGEFVYQFALVEKGKGNPEDESLSCGESLFFIDRGSLPLIRGSVIDYLHTGLTEAWVIDNPNPPWDSERAAEISRLFDEIINPGVAGHGGRIRLVGLKNHIAYVEMSGGCQGCSMAGKTLRFGVMKILADKFPEITDLIDVTDHASGTRPFFSQEGGTIPTFKS
jgi:Fe/S biogenesis protein NfuA